MKKSTILCSLLLCGASAFAAVDQPTALWGNLFDSETTAGDQCQANAISPDNNLYWHLIGGTYNSARDITYAGKVLFQGADYDPSGTSQNNNLCILKTDKNGNAIWKLYSTTCDYANNIGSLEATSDGGVVFTAKLRSTDDGGTGEFLFNDVTLVDGQNKTHKFPWNQKASDSRRYYKLLVGRLSAEGELLWVRFIEADRAPVPSAGGNYADFTAEAVSIPALTVDADDNIYIGGNYRQTLSIEGTDVKLTPHNISKWNGDPQQSAGDLFIIKFNGDGSYLSSAVTSIASGEVSSESLDCLVYSDGAIYAQGLIYGPDAKISFGGKSIDLAGDFTPIVMKLDTSLAAQWVNPMKGEKVKGKYGFQNCSINKVGETIWFTGQYDGVISSGNVSFSSDEATPSVREGFIAKIDAASGALIAAASSKQAYNKSVNSLYNSLCGYFAAIQNPSHPEKVYVYGYCMNANIGVFLRTYDAETLASDPASEWKLMTGGQMPTCQTIAYDPDNAQIFISARGRQTDFSLLGGLTVAKPNTWAILLAGYQMPDNFLQVGIVNTFESSSQLVISTSTEGIIFTNGGAPRSIDIFDISGRRVARHFAPEGRSEILLPKGFYIADGKKIRL